MIEVSGSDAEAAFSAGVWAHDGSADGRSIHFAVCESAGETAGEARDRRRVLASICRYVRCPRASPIAGAEYRLAGAALCHSPRGDTRTGASHFSQAELPAFQKSEERRSDADVRRRGRLRRGVQRPAHDPAL